VSGIGAAQNSNLLFRGGATALSSAVIGRRAGIVRSLTQRHRPPREGVGRRATPAAEFSMHPEPRSPAETYVSQLHMTSNSMRARNAGLDGLNGAAAAGQ